MKNKGILLALSLFGLLASCAPKAETNVVFEWKEVNTYVLPEKESNEVKDLEEYKLGKVKLRYIEGKELVPYVTFEQYASLFTGLLSDGYSSRVFKKSFGLQWGVVRENSYYFVSTINLNSKTIYTGGSLRNCVEDRTDYTLTGLSYQGNTDYSVVYDSDNRYHTYYFGSEFDIYYYEGEYYFPLAFLNTSLMSYTEYTVFYNYEGIFLSKDYQTASATKFLIDGNEYTFIDRMKNVAETKYFSKMPQYLRQFNEKILYYLLENMYGLDEVRGIPSITNYIKANEWSNDLESEDNVIRGEATLKALNVLDDDHTGFITFASAWGEDEASAPRGEVSAYRRQLRTTLRNSRKEYREEKGLTNYDIDISNDGTTASIFFDSFSFGKEGEFFEADGRTVKVDAYKKDTYIFIKGALTTIKENHPTVKKVVFDVSTNGGGTVGVMTRLLALISSTNNTNTTFRNPIVGMTQNMYTSVDSNNDGFYDERDVFGGVDGFKFYILTSQVSFSCANAFPFIAQKEGTAKIIGEKSGGGECTVETNLLPNGQYFQFSSNLHIGQQKFGTFVGDEGGARPDLTIDYSDFYDIEKLANCIKTL